MAEDLTEYLHEHGVRVRYMHSDIDTLERIEIVRDLRLGVFDVLVGINLLREGLDIPECGLVAILDADKEGYLRSQTSLIQTIGRAARNIDGRVILYADRLTGSLEVALAETERRRAKQAAFNEAHGITPESIKKQVGDIIRHVAEHDYVTVDVGEDGQASFAGMDLPSYIGGLEAKMKEAAGNLEFEEAARLRDEIRRLEASELGVRMAPTARDPARAESQRLRTQIVARAPAASAPPPAGASLRWSYHRAAGAWAAKRSRPERLDAAAEFRGVYSSFQVTSCGMISAPRSSPGEGRASTVNGASPVIPLYLPVPPMK